MRLMPVVYFLIAAITAFRCSVPTKADIRLVLTEIDTVRLTDKVIYNRLDYYLIKSRSFDPSEMHAAIHKYFQLHNAGYPTKYTNYHAFFYRSNGELNLIEISATPETDRWKCFEHEKPFDEYLFFLGKKQ